MTDCDRLFDVLKDGEWHTHRELYGLGMIVHSRIADLRSRGHEIVCGREKVTPRFGFGRPEVVYRYRLLSALDSAAGSSRGAQPAAESSVAGGTPSSPKVPAVTLDTYGVTRAAAEVNDEFPKMLIENGAPVSEALPLEDARSELAKLQATLWGEAA